MGAVVAKVKEDFPLPAKSKQHKDFAARLQWAMARKGLTGRGRAERLAEELRAHGLEKATSQLVSTWLRGIRMPRGAYADVLPAILDVPPGYLSGTSVPDNAPLRERRIEQRRKKNLGFSARSGGADAESRDGREVRRPRTPSVAEGGLIYPGGVGEEDAAYLRFTLQMTRELSAAEREGATTQVLLRLVDLAEKWMVRIHGPRAKEFLNAERERIQRGEKLDSSSGP